ncbi:MAG: septum site-determining protein MinC [Peptococcaceae bacterium]|nr:septum site-determining protein MinC [Peptococcaceae bacterium]MBQ2449523.1 septum site-determining protein MinC [Peptococcaceae bacterium]MBQ5683208.1 septum site-determining protein MinC [Peptococcaceae bacterium]MBQ5703107.1 septum site-determining protein MinC [Peptococcaceae bacterium]
MGEAVNFKGNKDGIVLLLDLSVEFESLCQMIVQKLWNSRSFLGEHTALIVNSGQTALDSGQQLALKVLLQSLGHEVKYFVPEMAVSKPEEPAHSEKQEAAVSEKQQEPKTEKTIELPAGLGDAIHYLAEGALVVRKNVRSGQNISYDGTLIVFGDVNAGAELVATGHILVLGTLRGVAHAGCRGNKQAIVYANHLNSLQLRIADLIARAPDGESNERHVPEIARIIDNQLVIEEV